MTKYELIAKDFRKNILNKFYYSGEKLPTESQLMEYYNVSRNTIRQTLSTLESEGYIYSIQGSGYYVRDSALIDSISLKSLSEFSESSKVENKVLYFEKISASPFYAKLFNIKLNSELYHFERIRYLNDKPVMLENTIMPVQLFSDFSFNDASSSIFSYVENKAGYSISHSIREYKGVLLDHESCKKLNVEYPTAATSVISTGYLKKEIAFEYSKILQIDSSYTYIARRV